jgi:hypothetical protein
MKLANENNLSTNHYLNQDKSRRTDRIEAGSSARVTTSWAAKSGRGLIRCVADGITRRSTATLESVVQAHPVTGFMSESLTQIVWRGRASWERGKKYDNTIICRVASIG